MSKTIEKIQERSWVASLQDNRESEGGVVVTLKRGFIFRGTRNDSTAEFDTLSKAELLSRQNNVIDVAGQRRDRISSLVLAASSASR